MRNNQVPLNTESASCVRYQNCRAHARRHSALPTAAPIHKAPYAAMCMHQCARAPTQTAARVLPICYSTPALECRHMQSLKQTMSLHATTRGFYTTDQTHLPVGNVKAGLGTLPPLEAALLPHAATQRMHGHVQRVCSVVQHWRCTASRADCSARKLPAAVSCAFQTRPATLQMP